MHAELARLTEESARLTLENSRIVGENTRLDGEIRRLQGTRTSPPPLPTTTGKYDIMLGLLSTARIDALPDAMKRMLDEKLSRIIQNQLSTIDASRAEGDRVRILSEELFSSVGLPLDYEWRRRSRNDIGDTRNGLGIRLRYLSYYCGYCFDSDNTQQWFEMSRAIETLYRVALYRGLMD